MGVCSTLRLLGSKAHSYLVLEEVLRETFLLLQPNFDDLKRSDNNQRLCDSSREASKKPAAICELSVLPKNRNACVQKVKLIFKVTSTLKGKGHGRVTGCSAQEACGLQHSSYSILQKSPQGKLEHNRPEMQGRSEKARMCEEAVFCNTSSRSRLW